MSLPAGDYIVATNGLTESFAFDSTVTMASGITWMEGVATSQNQTLPATTDGFSIRRSTPVCYLGGTFKFQSTGTTAGLVVIPNSSSN